MLVVFSALLLLVAAYGGVEDPVLAENSDLSEDSLSRDGRLLAAAHNSLGEYLSQQRPSVDYENTDWFKYCTKASEENENPCLRITADAQSGEAGCYFDLNYDCQVERKLRQRCEAEMNTNDLKCVNYYTADVEKRKCRYYVDDKCVVEQNQLSLWKAIALSDMVFFK